MRGKDGRRTRWIPGARPASLLTLVTLIVVCLGLLASCTAWGGLRQGSPLAWLVAGAGSRPPLVLGSASTEYTVTESGFASVELRLAVDNNDRRATQSTSILWEPSFAATFTLTHSEPAPWRVRIDERGWGVLDTSGILPGRSGTFRLWFTGRATTVPVPRVMVVANGKIVVADTVAQVQLPPSRAPTAQDLFVRGPLAAAADRVTFVPTDPRGALLLATAIALSLGTLAVLGGLAALRVTLLPAAHHSLPAPGYGQEAAGGDGIEAHHRRLAPS
jgi:hypothetical protein